MEDDWSVLFRPTVRRILQGLLREPCSLTMLASGTGLTKPALQRHLKDLERLGVVAHTYRPIGTSREVVYALQGCSLRLDLGAPGVGGAPLGGIALVWATSGHTDPEFPLTGQVPDPADRADVTKALRALKQALPREWPSTFVILLGSAARGESGPKSDIDLMIVLPREVADARERALDAIAATQMHLRHPVQPFISGREAFIAGRKRMEQAAAQTGMVVHGEPSERDLWSLMTRYRSIST